MLERDSDSSSSGGTGGLVWRLLHGVVVSAVVAFSKAMTPIWGTHGPPVSDTHATCERKKTWTRASFTDVLSRRCLFVHTHFFAHFGAPNQAA